MTDRDLTDLLESLGSRVEASPPPLAAMTRAADRTRRRRAVLVVASAAAAVAVVAAGVQVVGDRLGAGNEPGPSTADPVPAGMRLVGIGRVAVPVPEEWGTNELDCHAPSSDTVIIDPGPRPDCGAQAPPGVDAVSVYSGSPLRDFVADQRYEIDGVRAERSRTTCSKFESEPISCAAAVYLPSEEVYFKATSRTDRATVDDLLDQIRILDGQVAVPEVYDPFSDSTSYTDYAALLRAAHLEPVRVDRQTNGFPPRGAVIEVSPRSGTVLDHGSEVRVIVRSD